MKNIPIASPIFKGNEKKYLMDCIDSGWISSKGEYIEKFEKKVATLVGTKYAASCANGTVALHLALLPFDLKEGDEVIMPTLTYIATANAVKYCNATPVFVDSEVGTWNMDPKLIEEKITPKTKGIIVVHLYGNPVDMDPVMEIAKKHNLFVVEDAAESLGATYKGKMTGSFGDIGSFSFFGNKIITTGEGGMLTLNSEEAFNKIQLLKSQGVDPNKKYWHLFLAYNYRMTNMQAAVGLGQIEDFEWHFNNHSKVAGWYLKHFARLSEYIKFQDVTPNSIHSYWMFGITLNDKCKVKRDELITKLAKIGIETRPVFYPMHEMPPYKSNESFPIAEKIAANSLNVPTHGGLSEEDIIYIVEEIEKLIK